jgi:hypothetical protein
MNQYDSQQTGPPDPADGVKPAAGGDGRSSAASVWEGYSPDTLAALMDAEGMPPAVW